VLLLVTIGLVVVAAVTLVIGFVSNQLTPIYISIACSFVAAVVLALFSRLSRRRAAHVTSASGPEPLTATGPTLAADPSFARQPERQVTTTMPAVAPAASYVRPQEAEVAPAVVAVASGRGAQPIPAAEWDEPIFPIEDYDDLRVIEILPLLPELDADELEEVRAHEAAGRNRPSVITRIDRILDGEDIDEEEEEEDEVPVAAASSRAARRVPDLPIEEYDELRVAEILPLLSELEPDELDQIADHERDGANRNTILNRIERLQRAYAEDEMVPVVAASAVAKRRASAPATPPRRAPAKVAPSPRKAPAKKATAKKASAVVTRAPATTRGATTKRAAASAPVRRAAATAKQAPAKAAGRATAGRAAQPSGRAAASKATGRTAKTTKSAAPAKKAAPAKTAGRTTKRR
jgi:hypothetical protein